MTMPFSEYQALPGINWSTLKNMGASPLHYRHACDEDNEGSTRMLLGSAVHTAVLEPDEFPIRYAVFEGATRRGKAWDEFEAAIADKDILKASEYRLALAVRDAVMAHKPARDLLTGTSEVVKTWTDHVTGLACKCRIDHINAAGLVVDLKTTGSVDAREFERTSARMQYHGQVAYYERGADVSGSPAYIIAVEIDPPHDVAVFGVTAFALDYGDRLVSEYLNRVKACAESGTWPGRYQSVQELNLPAWMEAEAQVGGGWDL